MLLLLAQAGSTCALAGLIWLVQVVVYPAFLVVGPTAAWPGYHNLHSRRMTRVVVVPWAVQGASLATLLVTRPVPLWLLAVSSVAALTTVVVTAAVSVPLHTRLTAYDESAARTLVRTNWWRTGAWTVCAACGLAMLRLG